MPAKPFHKPITPDLSPNLRLRDAWFGLGQLLLPWNWIQWKRGSGAQELTDQFGEQFGVSHAYAFDSGRVALYAALRAVGVQQNDTVVIQSFTCVVVANAVIAAGATPRYVDVDDTYNIDITRLRTILEKNKRIRAVVVQHTFGVPARIHDIVALCKEFGVSVVEDCAHSLGATVDGKRVGTFGDAAIFSFGRDKVLSSVSGGVAISNRADVGQSLAEYHESLPYPSRRWIAQRLIYPLVFETAKWFYHVGPIGKLLIEFTKRTGIVPLVITPKEKRGEFPTPTRMPSVLAVWATRHLEAVQFYNTHRQTLANIYIQELQTLIANGTVTPQATQEGTEPMWLRWSMEVSDAVALRTFCKQHGVLLGSWYDTPVAPRDTDLASVQYTIGAAPNAEQVARRIVNVPTNINTSEEDARYITSLIKQFFGI